MTKLGPADDRVPGGGDYVRRDCSAAAGAHEKPNRALRKKSSLGNQSCHWQPFRLKWNTL